MSMHIDFAATEHAPVMSIDTGKQTTFTKTRRFIVEWDNSRIPPSNRRKGYTYEPQQCDGVLFGNGLVALDTGKGFETLDEMEIVLGLNGRYSITWID